MKVGNQDFPVRLLFGIFLSIAGLGASLNASAQKPMPPGCPKTTVSCPDSVHKGEALKFTAEIKGGDAQVTPTCNWSVSAGAIESGQGTSTIQVSTKDVEANSTVTATVELGGYSRDCPYGSTVSSATAIIDKQ
jgi:hypothetical protein